MSVIDEETLFLINFVQIFLKNNVDIDTIKELKSIDTSDIYYGNVAEIVDYIKQADPDKLYEELNFDFVNLFVHPKDFTTFPIASYHISENKTLVSKITEELKLEYLNENFVLDNSFPYKEDHIVCILEFIKFLDDKDRSEKIIKNYLLPWLGNFADAICKNAQTFVYRKIGEILKTIETNLI